MARAKIKRRDEETEELILDAIIDGKFQSQIAKEFGFGSQSAFKRYLIEFQDFNAKMHIAYESSAIDLEEQLLTIPLKHDAKTADVLSRNILNILKFRNRRRYGDKTEIEINQTVDITIALDAAMQRLIDVTPTNILPIKKIP